MTAFETIVPMRPDDLHEIGHVPHPIVMRHLLEGRDAMFAALSRDTGSTLRLEHVLAEITASFLVLLDSLGDLDIAIRVEKIGRSSFVTSESVSRGETTLARARATLVATRDGRSRPLDDVERIWLARYAVPANRYHPSMTDAGTAR